MTKASPPRACARGDEAGCWGLALDDLADVGGVLDGASLGEALEGDVVTLGQLGALSGSDTAVHAVLVGEHHGVVILGEHRADNSITSMPVGLVAAPGTSRAEAECSGDASSHEGNQQDAGLLFFDGTPDRDDGYHSSEECDEAENEREDIHRNFPLSLG